MVASRRRTTTITRTRGDCPIQCSLLALPERLPRDHRTGDGHAGRPAGAHAVVRAVPAARVERGGAVAEHAVGVAGASRADLSAPGGDAEPDARDAAVHGPDRDAGGPVRAPALVAARIDAGVRRDARRRRGGRA